MKVGASYYPELSKRTQWEADLATARSLGMSALRCGEFAWSRLSPLPDQWQTDWAAEFLTLAASMDFDIIWCTPSAATPPYLFDRWPDLHAVTDNNQVAPIGIRRNYCPSHDGYRELCGETAAKLGRDLGAYPAIKGWQIDNEMAGDGFTCWCPRCNASFQAWLEKRYGTLDALNEAWLTDVWSQHYTNWQQIPIPHKAFAPNHAPALKLAWRRFRSDNWLGFYLAQKNPLKATGVTQPVTTNFFGVSWDIPFDHWTWRPHLDTMSVGQYIEDETAVRFEYALLKGLDDKPLWVLEQKAGQQNSQNYYPEKLDRIERHLRVTREASAEYAIYWHLRQHQAGCEMEHGAVLRHDGHATRIGQAIKDGIEQARQVEPVTADPTRALVFDFDQCWAQENRHRPGSAWNYRVVLEQDWHGAARDLWGGCRIGSLEQALARATIVMAPHFQMLKPSQFKAIGNFLHEGGMFITTADFGWLDSENNVRKLSPLGAFPSLNTPPEGEMLHLKTDFSVTGQRAEKPLVGRYFWFVSTQSAVAELSHEGLSGPALLQFKVGAGWLCILTSAFDRASLAGLLPK